MSDLPLTHAQSADRTGPMVAGVAHLIALLRTALAQAAARTAHRRAMRRDPPHILAAQARREAARAAVDRLIS